MADTEQKGALGLTEFIVAMHLLASYRNGSMRALPQILPAGLYEAASRRGIPRQVTGTRPTSENAGGPSAIPRQVSGANYQRPGSPATRQPFGQSQQPQTPGGDQWAVSPQDKATFDQIFNTVDTTNAGFITGEQAVAFFSNSRLPEEALAQIWDLADVNSEGRLSRDEFAVAMYLIRQQRSKTSGRDVLPQSLPPNLVPPSMRHQQVAPPQPTAPTFDNAANITAPKSAAEDLFGLDAFSSPQPRAAESVSDSSLYNSSPPRTTTSPQVPQQPQQSTIFKPFIPSSSFGQTIMTPQGTGTSSGNSPLARGPPQPQQQQRQVSAMDDLLGDNDPEVSKKLTQETSELANLSNQVSTLTNQMQEVKSSRASTEQNLQQAQTQKRDFESRLGGLRSAYEQEVKEVKALEERLSISRNEVRKLQSDMAMIEGAQQDLQNQRQQVTAALEADQKENAGLKERIRQTNVAINGLKPQLEKMKSDARQQKGLVAINKKQLATVEGERDKVKSDIDESTKEYQDATKELEESKRALELKPEVRRPTDVASPAPSTTSMNPFFRRQSTSEQPTRGVSSPFATSNVTSPNHNAFDTFFGPSFGSQPSVPPPTSFQNTSPNSSRELPPSNPVSGQSEKSSDGPDFPTPSGSPPPSTYNDTPQVVGEPPAPPQSRQITSSFLPFGRKLERSGSETSSTRANPPASRIGEPSGFDTPTDRNVSLAEPSNQGTLQPPSRSSSLKVSDTTPPGPSSTIQQATPSAVEPMHVPVSAHQDDTFGQPSEAQDMPGGFPGDATPPSQPEYSKSRSQEEPLAPSGLHTQILPIRENGRSPVSAKEDFDSAFQGFGSSSEANGDNSSRAFDGVGAPKAAGEFPPIQEFGADDDSESSSDRGFEDDFTAAPPSRTQGVAEKTQTSQPIAPMFGDEADSSLAPSRPPLTSTESDVSQVPSFGAQASPPTYDQTISSPESSLQPGGGQPSGSFPQEYKGLLPSRDNPTSPPQTSSAIPESSSTTTNPVSLDNPTGALGDSQIASPAVSAPGPRAPMAAGASAAPFAYRREQSQGSQYQPLGSHAPLASTGSSAYTREATPPTTKPPVPAKTAFDDFDNEFGDLSEAREADEKGEDTDFGASHRSGLDEFNPTFDTPASTRTVNHQPQPSNNSFHDFESSISSSAQKSAPLQQQTSGATGHDWEAIFAGLDTPQNNDLGPESSIAQQNSRGLASQKPPLNRGASEWSAHDAPMVEDLMSRGFGRDDSVKALEKFDYNTDKVRLAFPITLSQAKKLSLTDSLSEQAVEFLSLKS